VHYLAVAAAQPAQPDLDFEVADEHPALHEVA
jgi:hypothetical protein